MAFNAFEVMRQSRKGDLPVTSADPLPEMPAYEAINNMDRLICLVVASLFQRKKGMDKTHLHDPRNAGVAATARESALVCSKLERIGVSLERQWSSKIWSELIACTSQERVESFCRSSLMNPSVEWRVILTEYVDSEAE